MTRNEATARGRCRLAPTAAPALAMLAAVTAAALAGGGCAPGRRAEAPAEAPRNVRVLTLRPVALDEYFEIAGPVSPVRGADISAEETGVVTAVLRDRGARVARGEPLLELDRRLLQAELESARSTLELQQYTADKTRQLFEAGKASRQELLAAEAQHEQARAQARVAALRYERAAIEAPFAGVVADRYVEPGQLVAAGTPVARVVDLYTLKLEGALTEREVGWVTAGAAARVALDGRPEPVAARVHWVGAEADPRNGKFKIELRLDNPDLALRGGVIGRARVLKNVHDEAIVIPRDAVVTSAAGPSVFVVQQDTARIVPVALGPDQGLLVVVADGLSAGDRVVVRGQRDLISGVRVRVTAEAEAPDGSIAGDPREVRASAAQPRVAGAGGDGR